jgi:glycosyltransferase involved in cell wall biosynthesis
VSIVLPIFNRERFLKEAFESILAQSFRSWELIVVDDGSEDNPRVAVDALGESCPGRVHYIYQSNGGPGAARDRGIDCVRGRYVAFFDSDDLWLPHHLADCVAELDAHSELDWVFGADQIRELNTGKTIRENTFYQDGRPCRFTRLRNRTCGRLHIITDKKLLPTVLLGDPMGVLQASVIRTDVFREVRIPHFRLGEDAAFLIGFLAFGGRLGYIDDVHVIYRIHNSHTSNAGPDVDIDKRIDGEIEYIKAFNSQFNCKGLDCVGKRALSRRIARECFWSLGYALYWQHNRRIEALAAFRRGIGTWLWYPSMWKTYAVCMLKHGILSFYEKVCQ